MAISHWTKADLVDLTSIQLDLLPTCEYCRVVPVEIVGALCDSCIEEVVAYLEREERVRQSYLEAHQTIAESYTYYY